MATTVSRINITLPKELISELRGSIPKRERSRIIAKALGEEIAKMKREKSFKKLKGIWEKAGGISFKSDKELTAWRKSLWISAEKRFSKRIRG
ncbi:MAG: hypothetical protein A3B44_03230 [Candidatus Levybacteria bacterium RIFCSPLOWO2_01_FULL_38_21]|nr:MAG: hypothetical protein A3B44_03230 [Candidatus Levybacteria bacterium RIFCSPLOWO2_01_FULL_38_21]